MVLNEDFTGLPISALPKKNKKTYKQSQKLNRAREMGNWVSCNANLHAEIERSDSIVVRKVFGSTRKQDLCCVSLAMTAELFEYKG